MTVQQEQAKQLAKLLLEYSSNEGAYFEYDDLDNWIKQLCAPNMYSDLNLWRVVVPPKVWTPKHSINLKLECGDEAMLPKNLARTLYNVSLLHAWATEHGYLKEWVKGENNYYIHKDDVEWDWDWTVYYTNPEKIYMTKEGSELTAKALNEGFLVLEGI